MIALWRLTVTQISHHITDRAAGFLLNKCMSHTLKMVTRVKLALFVFTSDNGETDRTTTDVCIWQLLSSCIRTHSDEFRTLYLSNTLNLFISMSHDKTAAARLLCWVCKTTVCDLIKPTSHLRWGRKLRRERSKWNNRIKTQ